MTRRDIFILLFVVLAASTGLIFAGKDGYTANNAMIVARSISVASTIDGEVDNKPPAVGSKVSVGDLLARIRNGRIDRGRLAELESQGEYFRSEIANALEERSGLDALLVRFQSQASDFSTWMIEDLKLRRQQSLHELHAARERSLQRTANALRIIALAEKSLVSKAKLDKTRAEMAIAHNDVASLEAQLSRIDLRLRSLTTRAILREDGDTSYWTKTVDALHMRLLDNRRRVSTYRAQLAQVQAQEEVERRRLKLNFVEEHRAPFEGVVNAVFTNEGKRVISGTPLIEVLDCGHPIAIVPIPEHRFDEFAIGQRATIVPLNSDQALEGTVQHISSGPLIGRDTTIAVQQTLTVDGSKVIVSFDDQGRGHSPGDSCDSARKVIATIHMRSLFDDLTEFAHSAMAALLPWKTSEMASVRSSDRSR